jgi:hypothetical protein
MMVAIMIGIIIITFFIADIVNQSRIETLTEEHVLEIHEIYSINENIYWLIGVLNYYGYIDKNYK